MKYNKEYSKKEIINRLYAGAKAYKENLLNKNILFIFENKKEKKLESIETIFLASNFLHLTGIEYPKSANKFLNDCLENKISKNNIYIKNKVFTKLKLEVLENAMCINKCAKAIGDFNQNKVNIKIEKVIGNTRCCLGLSNLNSNKQKLKYYYPKTLLQDNLKNNVLNENKILAILSKNKNQKLYNEITYLSNKVLLSNLVNNKEINKIVDYQNIFSSNIKYQEKIKEFKNKMSID